jgi:hypothetical protein
MPNPEALLQLERLAGRMDVLRSLGVDAGQEPAVLDGAQRARLQALIDSRIDRLASGLLEEAMASDDVADAGAALVYLQDRLAFLGDLLTGQQQAQIRAEFERHVAGWR